MQLTYSCPPSAVSAFIGGSVNRVGCGGSGTQG